jgi:leader peptidase (prepilin peptidase)/N-methyltransferase
MTPTGSSEWAGILAGVGGGLGLLIGSFLNVVVYRVPNGLSIASPPSACPRCGAEIRPVDNIPVVSWLVLRGKCRSCQSAISPRYPLVELGTGASFVVVILWLLSSKAGVGPVPLSAADALELTALLYLAAVTFVLALIDLDTHRLPNSIVIPSYVVGAVLLGSAGLVGGDFGAVLRAAVGMAALWAAYLLMALAYPGGMGFGDVKLAGVLGLFLGYLGWAELAVGAFAAFLLGGVFALGVVAARRANRKSGIPFGPWMLAGAWVGIFFGAPVWDGYLTLLGVARQ